MADGGGARTPRREDGGAEAAASGGVGPNLRAGDELSPRLHGPDPQQARTQSLTTALLHHRTGNGIPIRAVISISARLVRGQNRCPPTGGQESWTGISVGECFVRAVLGLPV